MSPFKHTTASAALALVLGLSVTACGASGTEVLGPDPAAGDPTSVAVPAAVPAADGPVSTRPPTTATVVDDGSGARLCPGVVARSAPPRCDGVPLAGWKWQGRTGVTRLGDARWGQFAVVGTFDGATLSVTGAVPAALYDAAAPVESEPEAPPDPALSRAGLRAARDTVTALPGYLGSSTDRAAGGLVVDVVFDDGSLQTWADETYGTGLVTIRGALVASR